MSRETDTFVVHVEAECSDCDWRDERPGALGRAAQHHDRTGHYVSTQQIIRVSYGRAATPEELGQLTIGGNTG
jgi:hypothetical protein